MANFHFTPNHEPQSARRNSRTIPHGMRTDASYVFLHTGTSAITFGPGEQVQISLAPTSMASLIDLGGSALCSREAAVDDGNVIWWVNQFPTVVSHMKGWLYIRRVVRDRQLRVEAVALTSHHYAALMCVPSVEDDPVHVMLSHLNDRVGTFHLQGQRRDRKV